MCSVSSLLYLVCAWGNTSKRKRLGIVNVVCIRKREMQCDSEFFD